MNTRNLRLAIAIVLPALSVSGCGGNVSVDLESGRTVRASSDSSRVSATGGLDSSTVKLGEATVVVEPQRIIMDGHEVAHISPKAQEVDVRQTKRRITIVADGKPVLDAVVR